MGKQIKKIYITTPLYYVNDQPHFGHLYSTLYGDFLQKYFTLQGHQVIFLVGCDQNGEKVYQTSRSLNQDVQEFIKLKTNKFKTLWNTMNIDYQYFVETNSVKHQRYVEKIFNQLEQQKNVQLLPYKGFYCVGCENYISCHKLENKAKICPDCQKNVTLKSELNYFLTINDQQLQELFVFLKMQNQKNVGFKWFNQLSIFLKDQSFNFPISRFNLESGISLGLKENHQTSYVWFDALLGYLSFLSKKQHYFVWEDQNSNVQTIHILGKEITKFHLIYLPLLLQKLSYRFPDTFLVHGHILNQEQKMSKSKGNVIDPFVLIEKVKSYNDHLHQNFAIDLLRLFVSSIIKIDQDVRFDLSMLDQFYQQHFLNNIWNFYYRFRTLMFKILDHNFPQKDNKWWYFSLEYQKKQGPLFNNQKLLKFIKNYHTHFQNFDISKVIQETFALFDFANQSIEELKLWHFQKYSFDQQINYLFYFLTIIKISALFLEPFAPYISNQIFQYFGIKKETSDSFQLNLTFASFDDLKSLICNDMIKLKKIRGD